MVAVTDTTERLSRDRSDREETSRRFRLTSLIRLRVQAASFRRLRARALLAAEVRLRRGPDW